MEFNNEIQVATIKNLAAKSKIMAYVFLTILFFQISALIYIYSTTDVLMGSKAIIPILGLLLMVSASGIEWATYKYLIKAVDQKREMNRKLPYVVTIFEISFPTVVLLFGGSMMNYFQYDLKQQLLSSAPAVMYFLMIILSSLMLDRRICIVAGVFAAVEYALVTFYLVRDSANFEIDFATHASKCIVFLFGGIVAGYVSIKIKESLIDSMKAKDALISKLDALVKEKTHEITTQKDELEAKNKDITDSIHYAKRIQDAQLPTDKFVTRILNKLRGM